MRIQSTHDFTARANPQQVLEEWESSIEAKIALGTY
jgi:hypothetical protein